MTIDSPPRSGKLQSELRLETQNTLSRALKYTRRSLTTKGESSKGS